MVRIFVFLVTLTLAVTPMPRAANAYGSCSEPRPPYCIDALGTFEDEFAFGRCRSEVERYQDEVRAYVRCLEREQDEAIDEANRVVDRFNCKADGGTFC